MRDRLYTTADLARVCGVSISTIKRWTDSGVLRCVRTPGGHRKFRVQDVAQAARQLGTTLAQADPAAPDELGALLAQSSRETLCERAQALLEAGDADALLHFGLDLHRHGMRLAAAGHRVLRRACDAVAGVEPGSFSARRARRLTERALFHLLGQIPPPDADAPVALVGGAPGCTDPLSPLIAHLALAESDWRVTDLGTDVPAPAWVAAADAEAPRLVIVARTAAVQNDGSEGLVSALERPGRVVTGVHFADAANDPIEAIRAVAVTARAPTPPAGARPAAIASRAAVRLVAPGHLGVE